MEVWWNSWSWFRSCSSYDYFKNRDSAGSGYWGVYHKSLVNYGKALFLDRTDASGNNVAYWNNTSPTSSVFTLGNGSTSNVSSENFIAYCFAEKQGYSKFGSYTGNGNADGTFVYTGFKPAFVMYKRTAVMVCEVGNYMIIKE
jgi:hypothetical protein